MGAQQDRDEFVRVLNQEGVPASVALRVLSDARRFYVLCEHACNRALAKHEQRSMETLEGRLASTLSQYGITVAFEHDPRYAVVKLRLPSGVHNDGAAEGYFCVPTQ